MMNEGIVRGREMFPAESVTVSLQDPYVPSARVLSTMVVLPERAEVVTEEQAPEQVMVPGLVEEKVYDGVVLLAGVVTGVTVERTAGVKSIPAI